MTDDVVRRCASTSAISLNECSSNQGASGRRTTECVLAAEVLLKYGKLRFRAHGVSMLPTVWPGDVLSVTSLGSSTLLPGEIVLYRRQGTLVAHRLVRVQDVAPDAGNGKAETSPARCTGSWRPGAGSAAHRSELRPPIPDCQSANFEIVTRGDSVGHDDPPVSGYDLLGRVTSIERGRRGVSPRLTLGRGLVSIALSHSDFCTRLLLHVHRAFC